MTVFTLPLPSSRPSTWLGRDLDRFFQESVRDLATTNGARTPASAESPQWVPVADISENEHAVLITLEVPGVHSESIEVLTEDSVLTIRGEKKPVELPETRVLRSERVTGKFSRQFRLSKSSDTANVTATYADGLLTVRVAKAAPVQPRRVTVQLGATQVSAPTTAPAAIA